MPRPAHASLLPLLALVGCGMCSRQQLGPISRELARVELEATHCSQAGRLAFRLENPEQSLPWPGLVRYVRDEQARARGEVEPKPLPDDADCEAGLSATATLDALLDARLESGPSTRPASSSASRAASSRARAAHPS